MKKKEQEPHWSDRLRSLMEAKGHNPRSLSLRAGLNPTAVRDMLEGRVKFPRYDTVEALAEALGVAPAFLMSGKAGTDALPKAEQTTDIPLDDEDLNLLTEIIMRLQETAEEYRHTLDPKEFAAMVTTIYRQMKPTDPAAKKKAGRASALAPKIRNLMDYERLRRKAGRSS